MSERLFAGWGVRLVDQPCGCDGRGIRPGGDVCTCSAGRRLRDQAREQTERLLLASSPAKIPLWWDGERVITGTIQVIKK